MISIYSRSGDSGAITGGVLTGKVQSVTALSPQSLRSHDPFTVSRETRACHEIRAKSIPFLLVIPSVLLLKSYCFQTCNLIDLVANI